MFRALSSAASGMDAQELRVSVIANNLANINTQGYKKSRADFQDLMYDKITPAGAQTGEGTATPTPLEIGQGVRPVGTVRMFTMGQQKSTNRVLDISIEGSGFFQIQLPDGNIAYSRDGSFRLDANGQVVTGDGFALLPNVTIPLGIEQYMVGKDGSVSQVDPGSTAKTNLGQIQLATFANPAGLDARGGNMFLKTPASGEPTVGPPGTNGMGRLLSGFLEMSNVKTVEEMVNLIAAQRAYETNSRVIKAADDMLRSTATLK